MSSGKQLQEMEVGTKQSKTAVNAKASPAEPMQKLKDPGPGLTGKVEDLGGPTPDNASPTNDSMKLKDPAGSLLQSVSAVNKGASKAEKMGTLKQGDEAEVTDEQEVVAEEPATEEVVAEVSEESVEETPELDIEEDVNALLGGEELSEEFRQRPRQSLKLPLRLALVRQEQRSKQHMLRNLQKIFLKQSKNSHNVLTTILSTSQKSGSMKTNSL